MTPRLVTGAQAGAGVGLGVLATFAWEVWAVPAGYPPMAPEAGAAVGAVAGPIYTGVMEVLAAVKERLVSLVAPSTDLQMPEGPERPPPWAA